MATAHPDQTPGPPPGRGLSPWPVRLVVVLVLMWVAFEAIRVVDRHAMQRQAEFAAQGVGK